MADFVVKPPKPMLTRVRPPAKLDAFKFFHGLIARAIYFDLAITSILT
jgi:hypothetical protein